MTSTHVDQADREQIATALDDTLIVEAAAGTGKTTELVRRIVRVIETGRAEVSASGLTARSVGSKKRRSARFMAFAPICSASVRSKRGSIHYLLS
jgi:hypothetical protein